jgi:hypothetical protein
VGEDAGHLFVKRKGMKEVLRRSGTEATRIKLENAESTAQTINLLWELG